MKGGKWWSERGKKKVRNGSHSVEAYVYIYTSRKRPTQICVTKINAIKWRGKRRIPKKKKRVGREKKTENSTGKMGLNHMFACFAP